MPLRTLIIVALAVAAGGAALLLLPQASQGKRQSPDPPPTQTLALDEFLVNLADQGSPRYLKVELALEVSGLDLGGGSHSPGSSLPLELRAAINDAVVAELSAHKYADLGSPVGKEQLRQRLQKVLGTRIAETNPEAKVRRVLFLSFVMQ